MGDSGQSVGSLRGVRKAATLRAWEEWIMMVGVGIQYGSVGGEKYQRRREKKGPKVKP